MGNPDTLSTTVFVFLSLAHALTNCVSVCDQTYMSSSPSGDGAPGPSRRRGFFFVFRFLRFFLLLGSRQGDTALYRNLRLKGVASAAIPSEASSSSARCGGVVTSTGSQPSGCATTTSSAWSVSCGCTGFGSVPTSITEALRTSIGPSVAL